MIVVVPVAPPHEAVVPSALTEQTPLSAADVASLYRAATGDVLRAVASSGGELLVNYRDEATLPEAVVAAVEDPEAATRDIVSEALGSTAVTDERARDDETRTVRFERQVGSTHAARVGNTVTHLLEREDAGSVGVGVLEPTAALVGRTQIDGVAMSLRRNEVVLGPAQGGRVYMACFTEPIDFTDVYAPPALDTLTERAVDDAFGVGFAPMVPTIDDEQGLCATIAGLEARRRAELPVPELTAQVVEELGLAVGENSRLVCAPTDG